MKLRILLLAIISGLAACATPALRPAPQANVVTGAPNTAYAEVSNVRVTLNTRAWNADPGDLTRVLTPLEVTLENNSGHPLSVRYQDFSLISPDGFRYAAIPPFSTEQAKRRLSLGPVEPPKLAPAAWGGGMDATPPAEGSIVLTAEHAATPVPAPPPSTPAPSAGPSMMASQHAISPPPAMQTPPPPPSLPPTVSRVPTPAPVPGSGVVHGASPVSPSVVVRPRFYYDHFYVSPFYSYYYPGLSVWTGPFLWDPFYYDRYYGAWSEPLPSRDMLELGLPEGVLQDKGRVSGFVYFSSVRRQPGVSFQVNLVDANTNESIGIASIPLVVR